MIQSLLLLFVTSSLWAQTPTADRFRRYCDQLSMTLPSQSIDANVKVNGLWAVIDATNGTDKRMREAITRGLDYKQFKSEMALKKIALNDQVHETHYAKFARAKCESTESGAGDAGSQAHNSPTDEQQMRKVNDSGIGVDQGGATGTGTGTGETEN